MQQQQQPPQPQPQSFPRPAMSTPPQGFGRAALMPELGIGAPPPQSYMPQPQNMPWRAPSPQQGFGRGAPCVPPQGIGRGAPCVPPQGIGAPSAEQVAAAARARAAEQMAREDVWKASNPDFKTPFASVEDAVSRLLPYHVFADYEDEEDVCDGDGDCGETKKSRVQKWDDDVDQFVSDSFDELEKKLLTFNLMVGNRNAGTARAEEQLMLERALYFDEVRQTQHLRAVIQQMQQQDQMQQEQEMLQQMRVVRQNRKFVEEMPWPLAPSPTWEETFAEMVLCPRNSAAQMAAQGVVVHPRIDPEIAAAWQQLQQEKQQLQQQQELEHRQRMMDRGMWPPFVVVQRGESSSSGQAAPAMMQQQGGGQATSDAGAAGMAQPWSGSTGAPGRD